MANNFKKWVWKFDNPIFNTRNNWTKVAPDIWNINPINNAKIYTRNIKGHIYISNIALKPEKHVIHVGHSGESGNECHLGTWKELKSRKQDHLRMNNSNGSNNQLRSIDRFRFSIIRTIDQKSIPKIWEQEGNKKVHSQILGTGRAWKKSILKI